MAKIEKLSLSQSRDIPFDKLVLSERNVRRIQAGMSIEELAEDIAHRTLLQSLSVRPVADRDGFYEVQAGGRRYRALALLVKQKRLAKSAPIPCVVRETGVLEEDSLAENVQRQNLHPLDQFRAFQTLCDQGLGEEEIAARFFVTPHVVKQRLKLASVSPKLLEIYAEDGMSLEQLMAFAISDDHARQEQVWAAIGEGYNDSPRYIRRLLTEDKVAADDKRVLFVGLATYETAGGTVLRDLFAEADEGWIQDVALLSKLVGEKLGREAEAVEAEGWKWLKVAEEFPYGHTRGLRRLFGEAEPMSDEDKARYNAMQQEVEDIEKEYFQNDEKEVPDDVERHLCQLEATISEMEDRPVIYDPAEIARSGVFISIYPDGALKVERGYARPEDDSEDAQIAPDGEDDSDHSARIVVMHVGGSDAAAAADEDEISPISERLMMELTAHRTLALRDALANDADTAFLAVLHALALQSFYPYEDATCMEIAIRNSDFSVQGPDLKDCPSAKAIDERQQYWEGQLPKDAKDLWKTLASFDEETRRALFAHCASLTINAVHEPLSRAGGRRNHADQLAQSLALDMAAAGWKPTSQNYLNRVSKARILEAVTEAKGSASAELIEHLRKTDMADQAERLLAGTGWLPEPLRTIVNEPTPFATGTQLNEEPARDGAAVELPDFLSEAA